MATKDEGKKLAAAKKRKAADMAKKKADAAAKKAQMSKDVKASQAKKAKHEYAKKVNVGRGGKLGKEGSQLRKDQVKYNQEKRTMTPKPTVANQPRRIKEIEANYKASPVTDKFKNLK